jgi:hypothetical protein
VRDIIIYYELILNHASAPTQSDVRFYLTTGEKSVGLPSGAITWLISGLTIEDLQYVIILYYKTLTVIIVRHSLQSDIRHWKSMTSVQRSAIKDR